MKHFVRALLFVCLPLMPYATSIALCVAVTWDTSLLEVYERHAGIFGLVGSLTLISIADEFRKRDKRGELKPLVMPDRALLAWTAKVTAYGLVPVSLLSIAVGVASCGHEPHQFGCAVACIGLYLINMVGFISIGRMLSIPIPFAPQPRDSALAPQAVLNAR